MPCHAAQEMGTWVWMMSVAIMPDPRVGCVWCVYALLLHGGLHVQVMNSQAASSDRFYATLYAVLLRPALERSSALPMIFGLLFQVSGCLASRPVHECCGTMNTVASSVLLETNLALSAICGRLIYC